MAHAFYVFFAVKYSKYIFMHKQAIIYRRPAGNIIFEKLISKYLYSNKYANGIYVPFVL